MRSALETLRGMRQAQKTARGKATPALAGMRLSEFAVSGRVIRLWSDVLSESVILAADNADTVGLPPGAVVYRARELAALVGAGPDQLRMLHTVKREFGGEIMEGE